MKTQTPESVEDRNGVAEVEPTNLELLPLCTGFGGYFITNFDEDFILELVDHKDWNIPRKVAFLKFVVNSVNDLAIATDCIAELEAEVAAGKAIVELAQDVCDVFNPANERERAAQLKLRDALRPFTALTGKEKQQ